MSLRFKVLTLACGTFLVLTLVLAGFSRFFLLHRFSEMEENSVALHVELISQFNPINSELTAGYAILNSINSKPVLLLKVVLPRTIYIEGHNLVLYITFGITLLCFAYAILTIIWLRRHLARLRRLTTNVLNIGETHEISTRLPITGHDEIAQLAASINGMLASLNQSENELGKSKEFNKNVINKSPYPIMVHNADSSIKYVNPAFEELTGFSREEVIGIKPPFPWWNNIEEYSRNFEIDFKNDLFKTERNFQTKSGKPFWVQVTATDIIVRGQLEYRLSAWIDITKRKAIEATLKHNEERFRSFVDNSHDSIFVLDKEANFKYISPSVSRLGYEPQELLGKNAFTLVHPEDLQSLTSRFADRIAKGGDIEPITVRARHKDGRWLTLEVVGNNLLHNPIVSGLLLTARDITERFQMEERLKASEKFSFSVIESIPNPFFLLNSDKSIFYVNSAMEKLSGFTRDEVVGKKPPYPWWPPDDQESRIRKLEAICSSNVPVNIEHRFKNKNGWDFWVIGTAVGVNYEGDVKRILCSWVDITEQKHLLAKTQFYISETTKAQEAERKRIAREIHDDEVQSLASLVMELDYLARDKKKLKKEDIIQRILEQRGKASEIVDNLRHFIHELRPSVIDQGLVPALELLAEELNQDEKINVKFEVRGQERRLIPETEVVLFRIAQEALRNIRKHSQATEAVIVLLFAPTVRLTVADNGLGFEFPSIINEQAGGVKLGLTGIQERALLIGAKLRILSKPGRGTKIIVEL